MTAAGTIRRRHSTDGDIQWLQVKPWMCSIGQCTPRRTAASAWQSKSPAICLHFLLLSIRCRGFRLAIHRKKRPPVKKIHVKHDDFRSISVIFKHHERCPPLPNNAHPPPKTYPDTLHTGNCLGGVHWRPTIQEEMTTSMTSDSVCPTQQYTFRMRRRGGAAADANH